MTYFLEELDGIIFIKTTDGKYLKTEELVVIHGKLEKTIGQMSLLAINTPAAYKHFIHRMYIQKLMYDDSCLWIKPHFDLSELSASGVYFAISPDYPNLIKVGSSKNISKRLKQLESEHLARDMQVIAYVPTDKYKELEKHLHEFFKKELGIHYKEGKSVKFYKEWYPRAIIEQVVGLTNRDS